MGSRVDRTGRSMPEPRQVWAKAVVWTRCMLAALVKGVKGGKWYSLMDKLLDPRNLLQAWHLVERNKGAPGVDHVTVTQFARNAGHRLNKLRKDLQSGLYRPKAIRRKYIDKPGSKDKRPLGIPAVIDRVVQAALVLILEPIFEHIFAEHSYGFRPHRGCKDALRRVDYLLKSGYHWVVDADIKSYFDSIPHSPLVDRVSEQIADQSILNLIGQLLRQDVMEGLKQWSPEEGTPQGAVLSPLLSNIYLNPLDHLMASHGYEMVRYADDFVILCRSEEEATQALQLVSGWTETAGLTLHPTKTRIVDAKERGGFDFLGYHFERGYRWPRKKSMKKLKESIRAKTKRANGRSLDCIIGDINRTLRGWFQYFKHSVRNIFETLDKWIRMRLRSILRKRSKRKGRGKGKDHQRWPNAYFSEWGLFSMLEAHKKLAQSSKR